MKIIKMEADEQYHQFAREHSPGDSRIENGINRLVFNDGTWVNCANYAVARRVMFFYKKTMVAG